MFTKLLQLVKIINGDQRPIDCPLGRKNSGRTYVPRSRGQQVRSVTNL